ncbi:hypothetical protein Tco_1259592 [Tanacetum coccineum]
MLGQFVIQDQLFSLTLEEFGRILGVPFEGQCSFSDKWSLDNLEFSVPTSGPYQTNPPTPEDIKLYVQVKREEPMRKDYGTKKGRLSTFVSSSSAFRQPSSSHHIDDDNDRNDEGTSHESTPSPTRFVNSLSNDIPHVLLNPLNIDPNMEIF